MTPESGAVQLRYRPSRDKLYLTESATILQKCVVTLIYTESSITKPP
jgi:hypothetical protein